MPLYAYRCEDCEKTFDYLMSSNDNMPEEPCKGCGRDRLVKQLTFPGNYTINGSNDASVRPKRFGGKK